MKNYLNCLWMAAVMVLGFAACDEDPVNKKDTGIAEGTLELTALKSSITIDVSEIEVSSGDTKAGTDINEYKVHIYKTDSDVRLHNWSYSEVPEIITLEVGNYRVEAHSEDLDMTKTGSQPYYAGATTVTITENEITSIQPIKCTFQNIKVQIICTKELIAKFDPGYKATVNIGGVETVFTQNMLNEEQESFVFFPSQTGSDIMIVTLEGSIDGIYVSKRATYQGVQKGHFRIVTFDVWDNGIDDNDEGQMGVSLSINASCKIITKDLSIDAEETPLPDEGDGGDPGTEEPGPGDENPIKIVGLGFNIDEPQSVPAGGSLTIVVNMSTSNGIKNLFLEIVSEGLTEEVLQELDLAPMFDLAYPDNEKMKKTLENFKFPVGTDVIDQTSIQFDISQFTGLLNTFPGTHKFVLTIVDNKNYQLTKTLTLITVRS